MYTDYRNLYQLLIAENILSISLPVDIPMYHIYLPCLSMSISLKTELERSISNRQAV